MHNSHCDFESGEKDETDFSEKTEFTLEDTYRNRMPLATREWTKQFYDSNPVWRKYIRKKLSNIMFNTSDFDEKGALSQEVEDQRMLIVEYITLNLMIEEIQQCEYYLRRFPFRGLPVDRSSHVTNVCEMYFKKCYQFKDRFKRYLNTLKTQVPDFEVGPIIRKYSRTFDRELKARNAIHHRERFSDMTIEKVFLYERFLTDVAARNYEYRRATSFWIREIQSTILRLNQIVEEGGKVNS